LKSKSTAPRLAVFTHDTYGLGHVRRCLHIVRALAKRRPDAAILFITGCPAFPLLGGLPDNADYIKIPTIVKTGAEGLKPPHLRVELAELSSLRERLIRTALLAFEPDILLVDNFPLGSRRELLSSLKELHARGVHIALGLRDIVDAPDKVCADWARDGIYELLHGVYDRIFVYGMREVQDVASAFKLSKSVSQKVHYCGYVSEPNPAPRSVEEVRAELGFQEQFVIVTVGGGGDGLPLIRNCLQALQLIPETPAFIVTGPLMSLADRQELQTQVAQRPGIVLRDYVPDLTSYMAAADVVVAMGGYNTTTEILALRSRAIIVPRTWRYGEHLDPGQDVTEWEQLLRAQALQDLGLVDLLEFRDLKPDILAQRIKAALSRPQQDIKIHNDLDGAGCVVDHILALAEKAGDLERVTR
jgi:predicted glycosyltransferase